MNYVNSVLVLLTCIAVVSLQSCAKEQATELPQAVVQTDVSAPSANDLGFSAEEFSVYNDKMAEVNILSENAQRVSLRAPVNYLAQLCSSILSATHQTVGSLNDAEFWDYYYFTGEAGDAVTIFVPRTSPGMDPSISLFFGTTTSSTGVSTGDGGPDMTFLAFADDNNVDPFNSCFGDPSINLVLPTTGTYTLAVQDFASCGTPLEYEIHTTGIGCDADGDGCEDSVDPHPNSDQTATVVIGGCDSEVANVYVDSCSTMSDLISDCAAAAGNHGEFVSCLSDLSNAWKNAGLISGRDKGKIQSCGAQSNNP